MIQLVVIHTHRENIVCAIHTSPAAPALTSESGRSHHLPLRGVGSPTDVASVPERALPPPVAPDRGVAPDAVTCARTRQAGCKPHNQHSRSSYIPRGARCDAAAAATATTTTADRDAIDCRVISDANPSIPIINSGTTIESTIMRQSRNAFKQQPGTRSSSRQHTPCTGRDGRVVLIEVD